MPPLPVNREKEFQNVLKGCCFSGGRDSMANMTMADWQTLSERINRVAPSATLAVDSKAKAMKAEGIDVIGLVRANRTFRLRLRSSRLRPKRCRIRRTIVTLRRQVCRNCARRSQTKTLRDSGYGVDPNQVIVTNGGKQAVYESFQILLNDGDEVIIPTPYWTSYPEAVKLAGACLSKCSRELTAISSQAWKTWKRHVPNVRRPSS
mgnify:CR=1 FL=1